MTACIGVFVDARLCADVDLSISSVSDADFGTPITKQLKAGATGIGRNKRGKVAEQCRSVIDSGKAKTRVTGRSR